MPTRYAGWWKSFPRTRRLFFFAICSICGYDDCCLKFPNGTDITSKHLIEITGLSNGAVHDTINSLVKKDIIYKGKNSKNRQYFINPWLFCKGNRINKVLKTMFKNYNIRIYGGTKWKDLKEWKGWSECHQPHSQKTQDRPLPPAGVDNDTFFPLYKLKVVTWC